MRILLYNIRYGTGTGFHFHFPFPFIGYLKYTNKNLSRIIDFVKSIDPDIVGLVEVDNGSFRSSGEGQADLISREIGHYSVYASKYSEESILRRSPVTNKQGNALLSRETILKATKHYFTCGVKRLILKVELEEITIFLVHLSLKFRHRQHQLTELKTMLDSVSKPVIVAGDLNTAWGDKELKLFLSATGLKNANRESSPSYPSLSPRKQLDFILCSKEIQIEDFMIPDVILSDHSPLVCDFTIQNRK